MANLVYKRSTTTSLKTAGLIDVENMTITVDGEDKSYLVCGKTLRAVK